MSTNLMQASNEWASRPADERFETLADLYLNCLMAYNAGAVRDTKVGGLAVKVNNGALALHTPAGEMKFNHWSFGQLASRVGAPASYLRGRPADLVASDLNFDIQRASDIDSQIYFDKTNNSLRAITSPKYGRIPNHEVVKSLIELPGKWVTPPARPAMKDQPGTRVATEADCKGSTLVKPGDIIAPAGLYASDRDMFAFLIDPETRIEDGSDGGLSRGFFVRNSEVGDATFELCVFYFRVCCGNHIIWGAENIKTVSVKHLGRGAKGRAFDKMDEQLKAYTEKSAADDIARIKAAQRFELGGNLEDVTDLLFTQKRLLTKKAVEAAYNLATENEDEDGNPNTAWGFVNGLTRFSQTVPYTNERTDLDRVGGKILAMVE